MMTGAHQKSLFQHYFYDLHSYQELIGEDGNLLPHWQTFFQTFTDLGQQELLNRNQDITRFLKENGVTYNIYGDPDGLNRHWNLDLIPFIISQQEWKTIEAGLKQRAALLDFILKDIYGQQRLIKEGLLPMELIYQHGGFLRQCAGINLMGKHNLVLYAADMARSPDGKFWIISDRTQAPSGSGYALENRIAMARLLPELFKGFNVFRLASYFNSVRNALVNMAPYQKSDPRIVLLTPGPGNETYFEHSYLASYLGITLAEGNDLMVKDSCVFLKTIGGLDKVDVILRRVDDVYCDPLELLQHSQLGVPGLLQAVRSGNVSIANPLGSSLLENPGLMPFLQNIASYFLNEELIMPTITSWWCGEPKALAYVLENINSLVIKKIYRDSGGHTSKDASTLSNTELNQLKAEIKARPHLYVGQEKVNITSTPSLVDGKIVPRRSLFRCFAVGQQDGYHIMPGGLTRTTAEKGNFIISNQLGGFSKDTWVMAPEGSDSVRSDRGRSVLSSGSMPIAQRGCITSRVAENLFWVGRYTERLLGNARFQRTVMQFISEGDRSMADDNNMLQASLLMALTQLTYTYPGFTGGNPEPLQELRDIMFNPTRMGSLHYNFQLFKNAVYAVRDLWPTDTWRILREMEDAFTVAGHANSSSNRMLKLLDSLISSVVAFIGLNSDSISREQGWTLLDAGRKIEYGLQLVSMLQSSLVIKKEEQIDHTLMEAVLKSHECLVNYRYLYRAHLQLPLVLELMLFDPNNPRSLYFQIDRLKMYLSQLPHNIEGAMPEGQELILQALDIIRKCTKEKLSLLEPADIKYEQLDQFLIKMRALLFDIQAVVSKTYFTHSQTQKQLFTYDRENAV